MTPEEMERCQGQPPLLGQVDRLGRMTPLSRLNLDKDDPVPFPANQINFPFGGPVAACQDLQPTLLKKPSGEPFAIRTQPPCPEDSER